MTYPSRWPAAGLLSAVVLTAWAQPNGVNGWADLDPQGLQLASVHAAVVDLDDGTLLYAKRADRTVPIASITKLMTAMVVLDSGEPLEEWLTIVERAEPAAANAYSRMRVGSELTRGELLRITLMASENLAAYVLSRHHPGGRPAFVAAMNDKARDLGMHDTRFVDASGLSDQNRSTASDLVKLVQAALEYDVIAEYSRSRGQAVQFRNPRYSLQYGNTNILVHRESWEVLLSKTGYLDAAGRCLVMVVGMDGRRVAMVLLDSFGSRTPVGDAGRISRWINTGSGGAVAGPALEYERQRVLRYDES
jgi:serine-type D-Ala-D-Ala endopeptidase (penicillin-binding protein 7)